MSAPSEYGFGRVLGEGAFANVLFARRKSDGEDVALKVMLKSHVEREGKTRLVLAEAKALRSCASCAFVVGLHATFQDAEYLFFALEFCASDLLGVIRNARDYRVHRPGGGLQPFAAAFYAGEVVLGLEFLREQSLAHRDLKPENVLVDSRGHCKLADFGAVLVVEDPGAHDLGERHGSFEGTAEYVSPEVLTGEDTTCACDLWALGCLCYQLSTGLLPFRAATDFLLWEKIVAFADGDATAFADDPHLPRDAADVARALLVKDAAARLGAGGRWPELHAHPFFARHVPDFAALRAGALPPPTTPPAAARPSTADLREFSIELMLELDAKSDAAPLGGPSEAARGRRTSAERAVDAVDWATTLNPGERLLFPGVLWKRKGLFWRERVFVLTDGCRLLYFDAARPDPELRGEIAWSYEKPIHCRRRSPTHFDVCTEDRDYHLAAYGAGGARAWISRLDAAVDARTRSTLDASPPPPPPRPAAVPPPSAAAAPPEGDACAAAGWVWKQGNHAGLVAPPAFKRRYAVLRGVQLFYYRDRPDGKGAKPAGVVRCVGARPAKPDKRHADAFAFDVDADTGRVFHIFVDAEPDRDRWLGALAQVIGARANSA